MHYNEGQPQGGRARPAKKYKEDDIMDYANMIDHTLLKADATKEQVKKLCDQYQVELIPHFYPATAEALGCGAVHLPLWKYRETSDLYGLRVGVSVHAVEEAKEAVGLGASYLTAGHVFATDCKKGLAPRGLPFLKEVCDVAKVPVYGIGGIGPDPEQIRQTLEQGAAGVCIMSGMMRI